MHHSESGILSHSPGVATPSPPARRFPRFANPGLWINRISRRWSIHQKIGSGYFLAVSIAVLGTATGLIVGEYYDDRARESLEITQERLELMEDLEQSFFNIILYQERLKYLSLNQTIKVENIIELNENLIKANSQLSKLQTHLSNNRELPISYPNYARKSTALLNDCDRGLDIYQQTVRSLLEKINSETITVTQAQTIKSFLLTNLKEELIPQFETISANLD